MSTLLLEALIMNRPTMAIAFGDGKHAHNPSLTAQITHFAEIKRSGALVGAMTKDGWAGVANCSRRIPREDGKAASPCVWERGDARTGELWRTSRNLLPRGRRPRARRLRAEQDVTPARHHFLPTAPI